MTSERQRERDAIDAATLAADIRLCLQAARSRTSRDSAAREAFAIVADLIVTHFEDRGYEVTGPRPERLRPAPSMTPYRREQGDAG